MRAPWKIACVFACCSWAAGCTVVKPVVGVFTAPVLLVSGHYGTQFRMAGDSGDGGSAALVFGIFVIGAAGGLVTGVISDWAVLASETQEPTRNWWDPLATNSDKVAW